MPHARGVDQIEFDFNRGQDRNWFPVLLARRELPLTHSVDGPLVKA